MSKKRENDFFNLNSDSSEDEIKSNSKWDWDKPENHKSFYSQEAKTSTSKRLLVKDDLEFQKKKLCVKNEDVNIEEKQRQTSADNIKCQLIGHKDTVNRIYWSKKYENKNLLLSSSMDR
jgi:hypothetical protein